MQSSSNHSCHHYRSSDLSKNSVLVLFKKCFNAFLDILKTQDIKIKLYYSFFINHASDEELFVIFYENTKDYHMDILKQNRQRIGEIDFFKYVTKMPDLNQSFMDLFRSMYVTSYQYNRLENE